MSKLVKKRLESGLVVLLPETPEAEPPKPLTYKERSEPWNRLQGVLWDAIEKKHPNVTGESITISCMRHTGCSPRTTVRWTSEDGTMNRKTLACPGCHLEEWIEFITEVPVVV